MLTRNFSKAFFCYFFLSPKPPGYQFMCEFFHNALQQSYFDPAQWKDGPETLKSVCLGVYFFFFLHKPLYFCLLFFLRRNISQVNFHNRFYLAPSSTLLWCWWWSFLFSFYRVVVTGAPNLCKQTAQKIRKMQQLEKSISEGWNGFLVQISPNHS